ncbi:murein biosynthesis integral membrane protein MurJ [Nocardioides sp.]|uniref:murein biosynthesis integral membrane protein MurJ n=1 Tax=Nocardioides sp. TaxID=35761 RepID=UPI0039E68CB0
MTERSEQRSVLRNSAVMAAGTTFSRLSGFLRGALLAAALGNALHADVFNIANTIPNMLYILLAGGVINAVLVPQLVRSLKDDEDGGAAYTARVITLAGTFLLVVTVALIVAAPWVMRIFFDDDFPPEGFDAAVRFARYCLPQVFFYGMFVLVGQILNARGRFGPMMWAPITNNVVSVAVLILYLVVFGADDPHSPTYSSSRELLLGLGSTLGIVVQLLVLIPYLRAAGVSLRPRWDLRDSGLSHTLKLGVWTVLFVVVNQIAYFVVVRLASAGTVGRGAHDTGYTVYSQGFILIMVPHSIITVSLATAILPRLSAAAHDGDWRAMARTWAPNFRTALAVVIPFAALLPLVAARIAQVMFGWGAAKGTVGNYVDTFILFGPGLVFFTAHYLVLRCFYAREENRTAFFVQCAVAAVNVVAAVALVGRADDPAETAPMLTIAYTLSYAVGALISYTVLSGRLGGLKSRTLIRFLARLVIAVVVATAVAAVVLVACDRVVDSRGPLASLVTGLLIGGVDLVVLLGMARLMRITEITDVVETIVGRLRHSTSGNR